MAKILLQIFIVLVLLGCERNTSIDTVSNSYGYVPIYSNKNDLEKISIVNSKTTITAGKIYAYNNYIFQNDIGIGIHIIDNTDKQNPHKIGFINIPYSSEMAIKNNFLYANNANDLVVFDISSSQNPVLINRVSNVFPAFTQHFPNEQGTYFECVDTTKGVVVGWKKQALTNPKCYR